MPPKSKKQKDFMQAVEHNPEFAKKAGVSKAAAKKVLGKGKGHKGKKGKK